MATSQARERLLIAAMEHAAFGGITDQSLREIASAIGTSHRMLLYHFGSREGLLMAMANAINEAEAGAVAQWEDPRQAWQRFSDPSWWPGERLFLELYVHALYGRPDSEEFFDAAVGAWLSALAEQRVAAGEDEATARVQARLGLAVARGLLLDLLATRDRDAVAQAYDYYLNVFGTHNSPAAASAADHPGQTR
jgi:AcrR family transcriptional regulator